MADITVAAAIDSSGAVTGANTFNRSLASMRAEVASTGSAVNSFKSVLFSLPSIIAGITGGLSVKAFVNAGDQFLSLKAKLSLFAQEGTNATQILEGLTAAANRSNAPIVDLKNTYTRNAAALNLMGYSTSEQIRLTETLYKALVIGGNATDAGRMAVEQFSQALNSGRLRGQDFNSVSENATQVLRIMAKELGISMGQLRDYAMKGLIPAKTAVEALLAGSKETDEQFKKLPQTVAQASAQFSSMFTLVVGQSAEATGSNKALAGAINEWRNLLISSDFRGVIDWFSNGLKSIADGASDAAKEMKVMAIEAQLVADQQKQASENQSTVGKWASAAGSIFKMGLGFWWDQGKAAMTGEFGMTPEQRAAIRQQAEAMAAWNTTTTVGAGVPTFNTDQSKRTIPGFSTESEEEVRKRERITQQVAKQLDIEKDRAAITQAQIAGDTSRVQVLQTEMEIRQRISDDMRKYDPEHAAALENEIRLQNALQIQLKDVQAIQERNTQFAKDFAGVITDGLDSAIRGGQSFTQILKNMAAQLLTVIEKAAILEPLGRAIGKSLSGALNTGGLGGFDIGNILGLGGGDVGLGSWAPTTTVFASGGVVNGATPFAHAGGFGVAGEDGPEAILPLTRGPNGDLGVRASGAGGSNVQNISITIAGDATEATIDKMRLAAAEVFASQAPGLVDSSVRQVAKTYRADKNYLRR